MIAPILDEIADTYKDKIRIAQAEHRRKTPTPPPKFNIRGIPTLILFQERDRRSPKGPARSPNRSSRLFWTATCERLLRQSITRRRPGAAVNKAAARGGGGRSNRNRGTTQRPQRQQQRRPAGARGTTAICPEGGDDLEIIAPTDLARSRSSMNLTELKKASDQRSRQVGRDHGSRETWAARASRTSYSASSRRNARKGEDIYGRRRAGNPAGRLRLSCVLPTPATWRARMDIYRLPEPDPAASNLRTGDSILRPDPTRRKTASAISHC